jgi:hypothetical protein
MGVSGVTHRPRFSPGSGSTVPTVQEAGWAPELITTERLQEKSFTSDGDRTPVVQSVQLNIDVLSVLIIRIMERFKYLKIGFSAF